MKDPVMKTPALATVFLDNEALGLMGDPKPLVSKIAVAAGKDVMVVQILRAQSATDTHGKLLQLSDVIDRTAQPAIPIYLRCAPKSPAPQPAAKAAAQRQPLTSHQEPEWRTWPTRDDSAQRQAASGDAPGGDR